MNYRERTLNTGMMAIVAVLSFALLIFVAFGEARRTYEQFYVEKLTAQNRVLVNAIESFLQRDLPINQYVGFKPRAERLIASDNTIVAIDLFDSEEQRIFSAGDDSVEIIPDQTGAVLAENEPADTITVRRNDHYLQVILYLKNETQISGAVAITMTRDAIDRDVETAFFALLPYAVALLLGFGIGSFFFHDRMVYRRLSAVHLLYAVAFLSMSVAVVLTLADLYSRGIQVKTKALADSLGERMTEVVGFNLDIEKIPGLDRAFVEYLRLNPDIEAAALLIDDEIHIHTDPLAVGARWQSNSAVYEYLVDISPASSQRQIEIAITLPLDIVYWRTARSVKNFAALFVATAFIASIFMQIAANANVGGGSRRKADEYEEDKILSRIKPIFYISLLVEHLSYAFMPQIINSAVQANGYSESLTSLIFSSYYLFFAASLIPAGYIGQRFSPKFLMICAISINILSGLLILASLDIWSLLASKTLAGIGQALLLIGIQSYILNVSAPGKKTQGAAIIVYGFQGGMISGMAIGSLLVNYIGVEGVFSISVLTLLLTLAYAWFAVVSDGRGTRTDRKETLANAMSSLGGDLKVALSSSAVLNAILCIGVPAKALLTGVVVFAIPLLMASEGYRQEDIGQLLMLYAGGVVLANAYIPKIVDQSGKTRSALFGGAVLSGLGLLTLSWGGLGTPSAANDAIEASLLIAGTLGLGLAHGLINAPIVSHVANLPLASTVGVGTLTATYRFLERAGHVAGPIVVGSMFALSGQSGIVFGWIGLAIIALGTVFYFIDRRAPTTVDYESSLTGGDAQRVIDWLYIEGETYAFCCRTPTTASKSNSSRSAFTSRIDGVINPQMSEFDQFKYILKSLRDQTSTIVASGRFLEDFELTDNRSDQLVEVKGTDEFALKIAEFVGVQQFAQSGTDMTSMNESHLSDVLLATKPGGRVFWVQGNEMIGRSRGRYPIAGQAHVDPVEA